jgi:hypothetical protein
MVKNLILEITLKKLCDVCGKFYKPFSSTCERHVVTKTGITFDLEMMVTTRRLNGLGNPVGGVDLCQECLRDHLTSFCTKLEEVL